MTTMDQPLGENETFLHSQTLFAPLGKPMIFSMPASKEEKHIQAKRRVRAWVLHGGGSMAESGKDLIRLGLPGEAPAGDVDPLFVKASVEFNRLQDLKFYTMPPKHVPAEKPTPPKSKFNVPPRNPLIRNSEGTGRNLFSPEEDQLIAAYYREHGAAFGFTSKIFWQKAAKEECFKNRSFEALRTRFNAHIRKKMDISTYSPIPGASTKAASVTTKSVSTSSSSPPLRGVSASERGGSKAPSPAKRAAAATGGAPSGGEDSAPPSARSAAKRKRSPSPPPPSSPAKRPAVGQVAGGGGRPARASAASPGTAAAGSPPQNSAVVADSPSRRLPVNRPVKSPGAAAASPGPGRAKRVAPKLIVSEAGSENGSGQDAVVTRKRSQRLRKTPAIVSTDDDAAAVTAAPTVQRGGDGYSNSTAPTTASSSEESEAPGSGAAAAAPQSSAAAKRRLQFTSSSKSPERRRETRAATGRSPPTDKSSDGASDAATISGGASDKGEAHVGLSGLSAGISSRQFRGLSSGSEGSNDDVDKGLYRAASLRRSLRSKKPSDSDTGKSTTGRSASTSAAKSSTSIAKATTSAPAGRRGAAGSNAGAAQDSSDLQNMLAGCSAANLPRLGGDLRNAFRLHLQVLKLAVDGHRSYVDALGLLHECSGQYDEALAVARSETTSEGCHLWSPDEDQILLGPASKEKRELISIVSKKVCDLRLHYLSS